jgi:hypothetical protein
VTAGAALVAEARRTGPPGLPEAEVRVPDKSLPSGYRIVDPRAYLAGPTTGGAGGRNY